MRRTFTSVAFAICTASPTLAQDYPQEVHDACGFLSGLAKAVMEDRQSDLGYAAMMEMTDGMGQDGVLIRFFIDNAFENYPQFASDLDRRIAIQDFGDAAAMRCYQSYSVRDGVSGGS